MLGLDMIKFPSLAFYIESGTHSNVQKKSHRTHEHPKSISRNNNRK